MPVTVTRTIKSSGGDYTSLSAWEAAENVGDYVATDEIRRALCYDLGAVDAPVFITGATTDLTRYAVIEAAVSHGGAWNTSAYRIENPVDQWVILNGQQNTRIFGLQVKTGLDASGHYGGWAIYHGFDATLGVDVSTARVERCILRGTGTSYAASGQASYGIFEAFGGNYAANNIVYGFLSSVNASRGLFNNGYAKSVYYNNTVYNCTVGIEQGAIGQTAYAKNDVVQACGTCFSGSFDALSVTNISDDGTHPVGKTATVSFLATTMGSEDFHLSPSDTAARAYGTDLSADFFPVTVDVDSQARVAPWDAGADQYIAAAPTSQLRLLLDPAGHIRGWFDPTLRRPGWFDDELTDLVRVVATASTSIESLAAATQSRASSIEALTQSSRSQSGAIESVVPLSQSSSGVHEATAAASLARASAMEAITAGTRASVCAHESLIAQSSTTTSALESAAGAAQSTAASFEAIGASSRALAGSHEALAPVTSSRSATHESLVAAALSRDSALEGIAAAASAHAGAHEALGAIARAAAGSHEALVAGTRSVSDPFESIVAASQNATGDFESIIPTSRASTGPFESNVGAQSSQETPWESSGIETTPVSASASSSYESLAPTSRQQASVIEALSGSTAAASAEHESTSPVQATQTHPSEFLGTTQVSTASSPHEGLAGVSTLTASVTEQLARVATALATAWENFLAVVFRTPHHLRATLDAAPRADAALQAAPRVTGLLDATEQVSALLQAVPRVTAALESTTRISVSFSINGAIIMTTTTAPTRVRVNASNVLELSSLTDVLAPSTALTEIEVTVRIIRKGDLTLLTDTTPVPVSPTTATLYAVTLSTVVAPFVAGEIYIAQFAATAKDADDNDVDYYEELELVGAVR